MAERTYTRGELIASTIRTHPEMGEDQIAAMIDKHISTAHQDLITVCREALRDLGELENHWKNESESFDSIYEKAERRMALENLESTRRTIDAVRKAVKLSGA